MKLPICSVAKQGLEAILKNPVILAVAVFCALLYCIWAYFIVYDPKLAVALPAHFLQYTALYLLVYLFLVSIIIKMVYDFSEQNNVSLPEAIKLSARKLIFIIAAGTLSLLVITLGLIALIIPGIFLLVKFAFISYFILLHDEKIIAAFKKSWEITRGYWWQVFGLYLVFMIPMMVLALTASFAAAFSIPTALALDFLSSLVGIWMIAAFTMAYIHLVGQKNNEIAKTAQNESQ
jgi:uncharacterized membrane protein YesL